MFHNPVPGLTKDLDHAENQMDRVAARLTRSFCGRDERPTYPRWASGARSAEPAGL